MTRPMGVATLLFFAIASLCLCLGALIPAGLIAAGARIPVDQLVLGLAIAAPLIFVAWAVVEALRSAE
jgi:hypothetical protein